MLLTLLKMAMKDDGAEMPKVDRSNLGRTDLGYIRQVEEQTRKRAERLQKMRRGNLITGFALTAGVFGIYIYSIVAVKQEKFLDDFEPPVLEPKEK
ncbi:cytochrome c oxidase assembly factor 3, mitochondrial [Ischnura elegans]|uniref:cytochrome c oxidase assembly factor 3, mitochondrial n=1 Tax=Ischnura elegans TaxID=197161 RepID=UPI001ED8B1AC|nr:cytochrome c oxidase assembly factor 3, mitochondrial [Ischnura elegans]